MWSDATDILTAALSIGLLRAVLASGLWIGLAFLDVAEVAMQAFTGRPVGDSMVFTIWGSTSSWTLTALPLFRWMGEILFRSRLTADLFQGLAPWLNRIPGRVLHANVIGDLVLWALPNPGQRPAADADMSLAGKVQALRHLGPVMVLIGLVIGAIYSGLATATESAALGVAGSRCWRPGKARSPATASPKAWWPLAAPPA